jgi:flagellar motor switch protein FliG
VAAVSRIFEVADPPVVQAILSNLAEHDLELAQQFQRPFHESALEYEDLATLDDETLLAIFAQAGPALAVLALTGSSIELVDRILARLPPKQARLLRHEIDHLGPTRLSDVEQAQQELVKLATKAISHQSLTTVD